MEIIQEETMREVTCVLLTFSYTYGNLIATHLSDMINDRLRKSSTRQPLLIMTICEVILNCDIIPVIQSEIWTSCRFMKNLFEFFRVSFLRVAMIRSKVMLKINGRPAWMMYDISVTLCLLLKIVPLSLVIQRVGGWSNSVTFVELFPITIL